MSTTYHIEQMKCAGCAKTVETALSQVPGVADVAVDLASKQVTVTGDADQATLQAALAGTKFVLSDGH